MIFVNLPVRDVKRSRAFFAQLGYTFNEQFSNENTLCMVISDTIFAMLLEHDRFQEFTPKAIADASRTTEVLLALSCPSKDEVTRLADVALAAGGTEARPPQDHGFMYARSINDLDGHIWELFWMDPKAVAGN